MDRLSTATLGQVPDGVALPGYDRTGLTTGIVHLGIGAFHRAHLAATVDACLADDPRWGICGVSLRSPTTRDALAPQDGLYTLGVQSEVGLAPRVIGAVQEVLVAPEQPSLVVDRLASEDTRIVSLTVTEKGYCHDPATGRLDANHPGIVHDLDADIGATKNPPVTAMGWLWLGLMARRRVGRAPYTILCCDNLPSNGATLRQVLLDYAALKEPRMLGWAREHLACPSTMVDRIVPATTDADRDAIASALGLEDAWPVMTEPFSQFVVEDHFPLGRPDWEQHGVTMTADVAPFERMKLRMLNGSHSTLAYLGYLAGDETVADTMADPAFRALIGAMMTEEIMPTLAMPQGVDLPAYRDALLARFGNPALRHRTWQIAMDGSQKLPQRLLGTIADRLAAGAPFERLALGVAAWMRYALGEDEAGGPIDVRDPLADRLKRLNGSSSDEIVNNFMGLTSVFNEGIRSDPRFIQTVTDKLEQLMKQGARATIASHATAA